MTRRNNPALKDILVIGMVAGGGYLLLKQFGIIGAVPTASPGSQPAPPPSVGFSMRDLLLSTATKSLANDTTGIFTGQLLNWWQWCFYYDQIRGSGQCNTAAQPADPARRISVDEFWAAGSKGGLTGLGAKSRPRVSSIAPPPSGPVEYRGGMPGTKWLSRRAF